MKQYFYLILIGGLPASIIVVFAALFFARLPNSNPFSEFSDLFLRDVRQIALERGFQCEAAIFESHPRPISDYCVAPIQHALFSQISLGLSGAYANEVSFAARENKLTFGDLAALWGKPMFWRSREFVAATWRDKNVTAIALPPQHGRIHYFLPVVNVSFTRKGTRAWSLLYQMGKLSLQ